MKNAMPAFAKGARILFQGDSITDGNRGRDADPNHILGHGYVFLIGSRFGSQYPERQLVFMNRGISGNTVSDMAARWRASTIDLKPDLLSILIGINDADSRVPVGDYERGYDALLSETRVALPKVRFVLCEPFILPVGRVKEHWSAWQDDVQSRQEAVARLAANYDAPLVKLQQVFEDACNRAPADYWIWDGIHPTYSGHSLIADEWIRTVEQFYSSR